MHAARFDVVVLSFRPSAGVHPAAALQLALKMSSSTARLLAERLPCVVLTAIPEEHAARVQAELQRYGAVTELRASSLGRVSRGHGSDGHGRASSSQPGRDDYEIGEILAPLGASVRPEKKAAPPLPSLPGLASLKPPPPPPPGPRSDASTFLGRRPLPSLFDDDQPLQLAIELPTRTPLRRPMTVGELPKPEARDSMRVRFTRWALRGLGEVGPWLWHGALFLVVSTVTLVAVGWAVRPTTREPSRSDEPSKTAPVSR
jgi:hypothetical protein